MQRMDLTYDELAAFHQTLRGTHTRRIHVSALNLAGDALADLSDRLVDGEVVVDAEAEVSRSLTLTLADPAHSLGFDTDSPDDGALFADRMLRVHYSVHVPALGRYVTVPVFTGPVTKLDRAGDLVDVEAQGKELLAMGPTWRPITLRKGMRKTTAIRTLLAERAGEGHFDIPDLTTRLPKAISLGRQKPVWPEAKGIAEGMDRQLFYPGTGRATLRQAPDKPLYTFRTGTGGDITGGLAVSTTLDEETANTVVVTGGKPKGAKRRVRATAVAEPSHPLSPRRLGRNGVDRHLVHEVDDDTIRSRREADRRARSLLDDRLRAVVEVTLDVMPVPHLDPGDLVRAETDETAVEFRLNQFTIPLGVEGGAMSVGYHRKTTVNWRRIRRP